jgi:multidrug efflux pump subunit AcrA (membrane-fusion protein)
MTSLLATIKKRKITIFILVIVFVLGYLWTQRGGEEMATVDAVVVEQISRGEVTSGIETTGEIIAAQKLNLDVYKQITRIEAVNVINGGKVQAGDVLLAFDTSNASVEVESSRVNVAEAELTLENERLNFADPNTTLRTLQNDIAELEVRLTQAELDKTQAYRTYLNADVEFLPGNQATEDKVRPIVSGLYTAGKEGEYEIEVYQSNAESGFSYRVKGLESDTKSLLYGLPTKIGVGGLEVAFTSAVRGGDVWAVAVPNVYAPEYIENREAYEETLRTIDVLIAESRLSIANKNEEIADLLQTDSAAFRDLDIARAQASLSQARVQLSQNFDVVQEQNIVAPFSGTVEGMENVVVGASPTRDTNDPITLGTLISDDFLATFSLSAVDVAKVEIGQLVRVEITSFPEAPVLDAYITEISSLPSSEGVAQYEVQALIVVQEGLPITLREGLLADIEIVEEVVTDVIRIPSAAITYTNRQPQVRVLEQLSPAQQESIDTLSVIRLSAGEQPGFMVDVSIGVTGTFYSEIISGVTSGQYIIVGDISETESALQAAGPGGRPQGVRPSNDD